MKTKLDFVNSWIKEIKEENLYRQLRYGRVEGPYITINKKKLLNLCSNDYLAISVPCQGGSSSPSSSRTNLSINQLQSSSRLVSGNDVIFDVLEKKLARHKSQQGSLIFPTGYMANLGSIGAIIKNNDLVLSDELNHASIIEACRLTGAKVLIYNHNDMNDLELKLKKTKNTRKFIITEGVFSMDGDFANLKQITKTIQHNDAILIVDDAHGDFVTGPDGKGTPAHFRVEKKIDLYISSLSKGLGSFGGYVASQKNVIDLLVNKSKSFIYTSALPAFLVENALKRFESDREKQRKKLAKNVSLLCSGLKELGFGVSSTSHIIPIIIGKEKTALEFGKCLINEGVYTQPIRYPTVPRNKARIRISVTAWFSKNHIQDALDSFEHVGKKFKII